jgi:hypothetical protein
MNSIKNCGQWRIHFFRAPLTKSRKNKYDPKTCDLQT